MRRTAKTRPAFAARCVSLALAVCVVSTLAPAAAGARQGADAPIRFQLRVFDGPDDVSKETRVLLYPRGQRTKEIATTRSADHAIEATVPPGFYDAQAIREQRGQVLGIRWAEQLLVQRYPDEHGRHLQVINFKAGFGALQVRPAPQDASAARGWSGVVFAAGDATREVAKALALGDDLVVVLPAGKYDVRVTLADRSVAWLRGVEIPEEGTRLKVWSSTGPA